MIFVRRFSAAWLALMLVVVAGPVASLPGCGPAPTAGANVTVQDPPAMPEEETTEALLKNEAKSRVKSGAKGRVRRN
jgi:hypothetical protein